MIEIHKYVSGEREVRVCKATGEEVVMEFTGEDDGIPNGNPGWLCLHEDDDKVSVDAFRASNK